MAAAFALMALAGAPREQFVVRVDYESPTGCPTESSFLREVLQRARHTRLATGSEPARVFRAVTTQESGVFRARLDFIDADSRHVSRDLEGNNCAEVTAALELVTALAIDPLLSNPTPPVDNAESPVGKGSEPKSSPPWTTAAAPQAAAASQQGERETHRAVPSVGAMLGAVSDVAPSWAGTVSLFSELGSANRSSAARLELSYSASEPTSADAARAAFRLIVGALEGCPWAGNIVSGLRLWPCAALEAGVFQVDGRSSPRLPSPNGISTLWLATDAVLRAEVDLSRIVDLEIDGHMRVPWIRNSYVYEHPLIQVFKTPALGAAIYVGVGLRLGS